MKVKVHSLDGDANFFDIVTGVLQGDTLAPYLFIICLDYILWVSIDLMKENGLTLENARNRQYPIQTITDVDYDIDIALLADTCFQAGASGIGLNVNADKMEYMCSNQSGDISTLSGGSLKLVDKFTYLRSCVSSTENDINMQLAKVWTTINRLSVIWKSDLSN